MLALAVIVLRLLQYSGAMILLGSSLFFLYAMPGRGSWSPAALGWPRRLLVSSAGLLLAAAVMGLVAQTGLLAGSFGEGLKLANLQVVVTQTNFGPSAIVRAGIAFLVLLFLLIVTPSRPALAGCAAFGAVVCASLAWMGHGAATDGPLGVIHLLGDVVHVLAAAVWIGALIAFVFRIRASSSDADGNQALYDALRGFSGVGSIAVALIVGGIIGLDRVAAILAFPYGRVLGLKLFMFVAMLCFAAINRYRLTPALRAAIQDESPDAILRALKRSLFLETMAGLIVLGLVSWLGALPPVNAKL